MPTRAPHPCATPGCPELVRQGSHCPGHESTRRQKDPQQAAFYRTSYWTKVSKHVRRQRPICEDCHRLPSKVVDHHDGDWRNNSPENLRALCTDCNASKTARQHRAKVR